MLNRISRTLLVVPMLLAVSAPAFAAGGVLRHSSPSMRQVARQSVLPQWDLKVNESTRIFVKAGDTVTFRLSGSELAGATAVLSIRKAGGANFQTLPYLSGKKNDPILLKVKIPRTWKMKHFGLNAIQRSYYTVSVIGRTKGGLAMQTNSVQIYVR